MFKDFDDFLDGLHQHMFGDEADEDDDTYFEETIVPFFEKLNESGASGNKTTPRRRQRSNSGSGRRPRHRQPSGSGNSGYGSSTWFGK